MNAERSGVKPSNRIIVIDKDPVMGQTIVMDLAFNNAQFNVMDRWCHIDASFHKES